MIMKKLMMIAAFMVAAVSANAQFEPGTFSLQPKIGGTISMMSNMPKLQGESFKNVDVTIDKSPIAGFIIGGEAEYQIAKAFSLAAGVNYSMQGSGWANYDEKIGDTKFELKDAKIELGYINIPIVANVYLFKGFAIKTGVQFGFMTNANMKFKRKISNDNYNVNGSYDSSIKDQCNKFDIAIPVGVSYQVPTIPIYIDGRVNIGLKKVFKDKTVTIKDDIIDDVLYLDKDPKNFTIQVTVGYKFAL